MKYLINLKAIMIIIILTIALLNQNNYSQSFSGKTDFVTAGSPASIEMADFNNDGRLDMVVPSYDSDTLSLFLNTTAPGASTPSFAFMPYLMNGHSNSFGVAPGDYNGDGKPDLAITDLSLNIISVLLNTTAKSDSIPTFSANTDFSVGNNPMGIASGDLNGDGKLDVVAANNSSNSLSVLLNSSSPGATTPAFAKNDITFGNAGQGGPMMIALGDINRNGKLDIVVIRSFSVDNSMQSAVSVILNTTEPGATTPSFSSPTDVYTDILLFALSLGDLNGDGKLDLVVVNYLSDKASVLLNMTAPGATTPSFSSNTDFQVGNAPTSIALGDVDEDGKLDMVVANDSSNTASVLINTTTPGATTPSFSTKTDFTIGKYPSVVLGDVNRDGKLDIATANLKSKTVSVLLNTTSPKLLSTSFSTKIDFPSNGSPSDIASADFNGDGKPDVAISNWDSTSISVFLNNTQPGSSTPAFFSRADYKISSNGSAIEIGDINNDGKTDLIAANWGDSISVFVNKTAPGDTTPTFMKPANFSSGYLAGPNSVAVADMNRDGKLDLAVSNQFPDVNSEYHVAVLYNITALGDSIPNFTNYVSLISGEGPFDIVVADFDSDGLPDIANANFTSGTVSIYLNKTQLGSTTPVFDAKKDFQVLNGPMGIDAADFNADGFIDIAVANQNSDSISILMNTTGLNNTLSFGTHIDFPGEAGPNSMNIHDIDNDRRPELIVTNSSAKNVISIFYNGWSFGEFNPYFGDMVSYDVGELPASSIVVDFNGDGKMDIATANSSGNSMSVLMNNSVITGVRENSGTELKDYILSQNYPNPFNPTTLISYHLPKYAKVSIKVYDILGREIATLINKEQAPGDYKIKFDARNLSSGVYFYRITAGNGSMQSFVDVKKMILLK